MNDWQPIETAPKDGTEILGWDGQMQMVIEWSQEDWEDGAWRLSWTYWADESNRFDATHWMPLPEAPK